MDIVFLGPSLDHRAARGVANAAYLPPLQAGQLTKIRSLNLASLRSITIIDIDSDVGSLDKIRSEAGALAASGTKVYAGGAAGNVVLHDFYDSCLGLLGNRVDFDKLGLLPSLEAVMHTHGSEEADYSRLTESVYDICSICERAYEAGHLSRSSFTRIREFTLQTHRLDRDISQILSNALPENTREFHKALAFVLAEDCPSSRLAESALVEHSRLYDARKQLTKNDTALLQASRNQVRERIETSKFAGSESWFCREPTAVSEKKALLRLLSRAEVARSSQKIGNQAVREVSRRIRKQFDLLEGEHFERWLRERQVTVADFVQAMYDFAALEHLEKLLRSDVSKALPMQRALSSLRDWTEQNSNMGLGESKN